MLDFIGGKSRDCAGVSRRAVLRAGALTLGGFTLADLLRARADGLAPVSGRKSVILIWQAGGPSHIDMYDLKPNAPAEIRGEFKPISTAVQRRHPTCSLSTGTDSAVTNSGLAKISA